KKWAKLGPAERRLPQAPDRKKGRLGDVMRADLYPADGLVLTEITRALPYDPPKGVRYDPKDPSHPRDAYRDHAWLRKGEARQLLPKRIEAGAAHDVPRRVLDRLVLVHLGTNTESIAVPFSDRTLKEARLTVTVVKVAGGRAECWMKGA